MDLPNYYYIIGSKNYLLKEEPIEEILRERSNYYLKKGKNIDFWLINDISKIELDAIEIDKKYKDEILNKLDKYLIVLSTNKSFISWLKLRFDYTLKGKFNRSKNLLKN